MAFVKEEAYRLLQKSLMEGRLAHAYLISCASKACAESFANEVAGLFLETQSVLLNRHPDFHFIAPVSKSRRLLIEQIRALEQAIHHKPERGSRKVAIVNDADRIMPQAANAFLKTLEEPPLGSLLMLTTQFPEALLDTIRSRCIAVSLQSSDPPSINARGERLLATLPEFFEAKRATSVISAAFRLSKLFANLLSEAREEALEGIKHDLSLEKSSFGKTTERDWGERENCLKARAESEVLQERSSLLEVITNYFGFALRELCMNKDSINVEKRGALLRAIDAMHKIAISLNRGVHEGLALEAGFLEVMIAFDENNRV